VHRRFAVSLILAWPRDNPAAALRSVGVPFEEHVSPDEIHGFLLHRSWIKAYELAAEFFNRHFKTTPSP